MESSELNKIFKEIRKRMSSLDVAGLRNSRKVEGLYSLDQETQGFSNILIYLDQGLYGQEEQIASTLYEIDRYIGGYHNDRRMRYLFLFGDSEEVITRQAHTSISRMSLSQFNQWAASLQTTNVTAGSVNIPSLFVGQKSGSRPCPGKSDLLIFFSRSRHVTMTEDIKHQYHFLKGNALWFFFEGNNFIWEFGFDPHKT